MKKVFICLALMSMTACQLPAGPATVSSQSKVDEQVMLGFELSYKFARLSLEAALDAGKIPAADKPIWQQRNRTAYAALQKLRVGYTAANVATFNEAVALFTPLLQK